MSKLPVLVVEDDPDLRAAICDTLRLAKFDVREASDGSMALESAKQELPGLILSDINMSPMDGYSLLSAMRNIEPGIPFLMMTAYESVKGAITAIRGGATDYLVKPFEAEALVSSVKKNIRNAEPEHPEFIAVDESAKSVFRLAERVARCEATVLISGESGTGKEVVARYIHRSSERAKSPFVAVNCAAIPDNLLEATMFGYERGAFTGAHKTTTGKFEEAHTGTLLLDEISELDLGLQAKLLRVLQENQLERIGGNKPVNLNVRVLATTNRDLSEEVRAGRFRADLFYRLNVFPINTVPLRERRADIVPLFLYIIQRVCDKQNRVAPELTPEARSTVQSHNWPGNVRELSNVIERSLIMCDGYTLQSTDVIFDEVNAKVDKPSPKSADLTESMRTHEADRIVAALKEENGRRREAARRLGISARTLRYKLARMREMGVVVPGAAA